ncbi:cytochrome P450 [Acephala macrosclerotiorum]|nr:cytochrome P450 [Acephala macrosclerotiorum]
MAVVELITSGLVYKSLFVAIIGVISKWLYDRRKERQVICEFKHRWPWALDLIKSHVATMLTDHALALQVEFTKSLGITFAAYMFGCVGYFTSDPRNIEAITTSRFQDIGLGCRRPACYPFLGEGIFTQDGPPWKHSREMLRRQFARVQARDLETFIEQVENLISTFRNSKGIVDLQPAFFRFTLATATTLLFGESIETLSEREQEEFAEHFDRASKITAVRLPLADLCFLQDHGYEEASQKYPFILDLYNEYQDSVLVRDQLVNVLLAGRDTTACTMSWAIFHLIRHPSKLQHLREEIMSVAGFETVITRSHTRNIPYLTAVLNETLRLYPQVPINTRSTIKTTLLPKGGGPDGEAPVLVPRKAGITFSPYHMHRRKELFGEDANEYRPERWLDGSLSNIGYAYMPFLHGHRTCLGKDFALSEASYSIVRLLQAYPNLKLPPGTVVEPTGQEKQVLTLVVSSLERCKVVLD